MRCVAYCTGENYNLKALSQFFARQRCKFKLHNKEVLHVSQYDEGSDLFFFDYGCVVFLKYTDSQEESLLRKIEKFSVQPLKKPIFEEFNVTFRRAGSKTIIENDTIVLGGNRVFDRLTLSFALSQSVKLSYFEDVLEQTGRETKHIPLELAQKGKISLSRRQICQKDWSVVFG